LIFGGETCFIWTALKMGVRVVWVWGSHCGGFRCSTWRCRGREIL